MNIWTFVVRYDGELAVSTHITEQGALLTAIGDVVEYLGIDEGYFSTCAGHMKDEETYPPWKNEELKALTRVDLRRVFLEWGERTWDHHNYECEVIKTQVAP